MGGSDWAWDGLQWRCDGSSRAAAALGHGGSALVRREGDGRAWKVPRGEGKLMGCSLWTEMGWGNEFVYELKLGVPMADGHGGLGGWVSVGGGVLPLL